MTAKSVSAENVLLKKFIFTIFVLLIFRLGVHIPTPGVNTKALIELTSQTGGLVKILNMFSGGALNRFSVFALGIFPYISASIIIQIMSVVVPSLEQLQKEGGTGRQKITRITRLLAVTLALLQGYMFTSTIEAMSSGGTAVVLDPGWKFRILTSVLLATGTCFVMWLGEQITEKGIGNGSSLLIFAGIVAYFPQNFSEIIEKISSNQTGIITVIIMILFMISLVFGVAFIEQSFRKIPIHFARRTIGKTVMSAQVSHLPLKVNMSGVIPAIFASTLLSVPLTFQGFMSKSKNVWLDSLNYNNWLYNTFYAFLVVFFCFFYTSIVFKPDDIAENLKKQNAYIPGIRPGTETSDALDMVVSRLTLAGAFYMNIVCLFPVIAASWFSNDNFSMGGTSLLIVVGVALDTIRQVTAQMSTQKYDNLL